VAGGISAGCLEAALTRTAWWRVRSAPAVLVTYDSTSDDDELGWGSGYGCNGVVEILLEREHLGSDAALDFIVKTVDSEQCGALMSVFRSNATGVPIGSHISMTSEGHVAFLDDAAWGSIFGPDASLVGERVLRTKQAESAVLTAREGSVHVLVEPVMPPPRLFICGEGPDAVPLARFARDLGWNIVIWASEPRWLSRERFHGLGELATGSPRALRAAVDASAAPAVVVLSHHYDRDRELLDTLLGSKADYIGVLGPRARSRRLLDEIAERPLSIEVIQRVRAPIGLDIGAETPSEIALAIVAEIQTALRGASGEPLSRRNGRIHAPSRMVADQHVLVGAL
jgi:xanthine/CO dehydrogenase XdhC/CoxF family maturation factor